jgi:hypothetical protein
MISLSVEIHTHCQKQAPLVVEFKLSDATGSQGGGI